MSAMPSVRSVLILLPDHHASMERSSLKEILLSL